ncbi:MAG: thiamine pyrophosphate-dependent dehydrogenase E1 component subunit alpha [Acidobacteriota bacterium]|nr:thiamine pyrophosphate-dependent dehydrogenase E1 component subunit alpha [Acidobacteriota bacterium]
MVAQRGIAGEAFYRGIYLIRRFEELLLDLFAAGKLSGTTHTCLGQEANAVALAAHLQERDVVVSNHRCHGHYLARTGDVEGLLAEIRGRRDGLCSGRGGSQHLCAPNFYTNGIQGGIVPLATGMALAEKRRGSGAIVTVFIGDGTLGQGVVYESLNIAALWAAPLLVVVEANGWAQSTPTHRALAGSIEGRMEAFGIPCDSVEGNDVFTLDAAASQAVARVRETSRPCGLLIHTQRLGPHSKGDDPRSRAEIDALRKRDPLPRLAATLDPRRRQAIEADCEQRLATALAATGGAP